MCYVSLSSLDSYRICYLLLDHVKGLSEPTVVDIYIPFRQCSKLKLVKKTHKCEEVVEVFKVTKFGYIVTSLNYRDLEFDGRWHLPVLPLYHTTVNRHTSSHEQRNALEGPYIQIVKLTDLPIDRSAVSSLLQPLTSVKSVLVEQVHCRLSDVANWT